MGSLSAALVRGPYAYLNQAGLASVSWEGIRIAVPQRLLDAATGRFVLALVVLIELVERRGWRLFTIPGRNPLATYLFSELFVMTLALIPVAVRTIRLSVGRHVWRPGRSDR